MKFKAPLSKYLELIEVVCELPRGFMDKKSPVLVWISNRQNDEPPFRCVLERAMFA